MNSPLPKRHADDQRSDDEPDRGVHEVGEGHAGLADQEQGLNDPDGDAGDADGDDLEHPPGGGDQEQGNGRLAFPGQGEMLALGVNGVGEGRGKIDDAKQRDSDDGCGELGPVDSFEH
jgi:hypothetical protein